MIAAHPLSWPTGWPRTPPIRRLRAKFSKERRSYNSVLQKETTQKGDISIDEGCHRIMKSLSLMGIDRQDMVISTNVRLRMDGLPRSGEREPDDPGAAVYWTDSALAKQAPRCMAIDIYDRCADNLAAIAATLEAMRAIERHGGAKIMERAFQGFAALPAPGNTTRNWRDVLELDGDQSLEKAREQYRRLAGSRHPDRGGSDAAMAELNAAWAQAQEAL